MMYEKYLIQVKGQRLEVREQESRIRECSISTLYPSPFTLVVIVALTLLLSCAQDHAQGPDDHNNHSATSFSSEGVSLSSGKGTSSGTSTESSAKTSSSSAEAVSSSVARSSSSAIPCSASYNKASLNTQACTFTQGTGSPAYGTLACAEKTYKTVKIGSAVWMAENLNFGTMVKGFPSSGNQSNDAVAEKYCYRDVVANCATEGALYQWTEAMQLPSTCDSTECASQISCGYHQGICPTGWHVPKASDWAALTSALGATASTVGAMMKLNTTGNASWDASTYNNGNSSGFSARPAHARDYRGGYFGDGDDVAFWEATDSERLAAKYRCLGNDTTELIASHFHKTIGFSLRCVKDSN